MQIEIQSHNDFDMSNWEITHTFDGFNASNNKINIIKQLDTYLLTKNSNENRIFIFDKSFNINTSYLSYFKNGNILNIDDINDLKHIIYMGNIIPMEYNEKLFNIQYILNFYKIMNGIVREFRRKNLVNICPDYNDLIGYINSISGNIPNILRNIYITSKNNIDKTYLKNNLIKNNTYDTSIEKLSRTYKNKVNNYNEYMEKSKINTNKNFKYIFNNFSRPIIGIYNDKRQIKIINYEQMYKKGKESDKDLTLISITRNSPVKMKFIIVGAMETTMKYLAKVKHKQSLDDKDIPLKDSELLSSILVTKDDTLYSLAKQILMKVSELTDRRKVNLRIVNCTESIRL